MPISSGVKEDDSIMTPTPTFAPACSNVNEKKTRYCTQNKP